jgi:methionyl-tRNA formyltransferase
MRPKQSNRAGHCAPPDFLLFAGPQPALLFLAPGQTAHIIVAMDRKRIVFFGTPDYAAPSLQALVMTHDVVLAVTAPDKPRGRGRAPEPSFIKRQATAMRIDTIAPEDVNAMDVVDRIRAAEPDVLAVISYGYLLKTSVLESAHLGAVNAHGSLLPRWRGAAPIQRAIMAGDIETGVTMIKLVRRMDAGPMLARQAVPIEPYDSYGTLSGSLAILSARMFPGTLAELEDLEEKPQDESLATFAPKIDKEELRLDWSMDAAALARRVRALSPSPGAFTTLPDGKRLRILDAEAADGPAAASPGALRREGEDLFIAAAGGWLRLLTVQLEGKKPMGAAEFLRGHKIN